jgi:hypothetical protein
MATTDLILTQAANLQRDLTDQITAFFDSLDELNSLNAMGVALVEQSRAITVFKRDAAGKITVSDPNAYVSASEQVQALKSVMEQITDLYEPFAAGLFKAHRTVTGLRADNLRAPESEVKRLKLEREQFAQEEEHKRREAAQKAQQEAQEREQARLIAEASAAAASGDSGAAEAILNEAVNVQAPPVVLPSTVPQMAGVSFRSVWEWVLEDRRKLKDEFLKVDEVAIGKMVRSMHEAASTLVGEKGAIRVIERKVPVDR